MDQIAIGINENVMISKAEINQKKQLELTLSPAAAEGEKQPDIFDAMLTAGVQNEGTGSMSLRLLSPLVPKATTKRGETQTQEKRVNMAVADLNRLRNQLVQILEQFFTLDQIDLNTIDVQFAGTGITDAASLQARILDQDVLDRVYDNLVKRFLELMKDLIGKHEPVRFKLLRQSKEKHFAMIPSRYIADQPFIELMTVPKDQSRVKFSAYELKEGLDNGTPISSDKAEDKTAATAPAAAAEVAGENPFAPH